MVEVAVARGYQYVAITDHSPSRGGNPGGLTIEETAVVLRLSPATIKREWSTAKAWLYHELAKE